MTYTIEYLNVKQRHHSALTGEMQILHIKIKKKTKKKKTRQMTEYIDIAMSDLVFFIRFLNLLLYQPQGKTR